MVVTHELLADIGMTPQEFIDEVINLTYVRSAQVDFLYDEVVIEYGYRETKHQILELLGMTPSVPALIAELDKEEDIE